MISYSKSSLISSIIITPTYDTSMDVTAKQWVLLVKYFIFIQTLITWDLFRMCWMAAVASPLFQLYILSFYHFRLHPVWPLGMWLLIIYSRVFHIQVHPNQYLYSTCISPVLENLVVDLISTLSFSYQLPQFPYFPNIIDFRSEFHDSHPQLLDLIFLCPVLSQ